MELQPEAATQFKRGRSGDAAGSAGDDPHAAVADARVVGHRGRFGHRVLQPPPAAGEGDLIVDRAGAQFADDVFGQQLGRLVVGSVDGLDQQPTKTAKNVHFQAQGLDEPGDRAAFGRGHAAGEAKIAPQRRQRHQRTTVEHSGVGGQLDPALTEKIRRDDASMTPPLPDRGVGKIARCGVSFRREEHVRQRLLLPQPIERG